MLSTDKGLELLPSLGLIYEKLEIKEYMKKQTEKALNKNKGLNKEELAEKIGMDVMLDTLFLLIFKNAKLIKEEVFEIVSIVQEIDIETVKSQGLIKSIMVMKELLKDEDLRLLFS